MCDDIFVSLFSYFGQINTFDISYDVCVKCSCTNYSSHGVLFLSSCKCFLKSYIFCGSNRRITIVTIWMWLRLTLWVGTDNSDEPSRALWNFGTLLGTYSLLFSEAPHSWHWRFGYFETYGFATGLLAWKSIWCESKYRLSYVLCLLCTKCVNYAHSGADLY